MVALELLSDKIPAFHCAAAFYINVLTTLIPKYLLNAYAAEAVMAEEDHASKKDSENYKLRMGLVDSYICAICDEGGKLIRCDGDCRRYFHPTISSGAYCSCETLKMNEERAKSSKFICKNCKHKQHQCFGCGELGSSDMSSGSAEVYQCSKNKCRRFYHPKCLAVYDPSKKPPVFECPLHECFSCKNKGENNNEETCKNKGQENIKKKQGEDNKKMHLCVLICRDISSVAEGCVPRKWKIENGCVFFYCWKHKMVKHLRSATRDHLKFPEAVEEHREKHVPKKELANQETGVHVRKQFKCASRKQGGAVEKVDDGNKESDPVQKNGDINLRAHEQSESPRRSMVDRNASTDFVLSFAPKSLFPLPYPGTCGWLDD
uniref:Zinc finger PHD-type domain-containing protein n=1 Tax=Leersia perrieri TaxID=77586 RepID=A0A0D9VSB1_9ORYZ